jgi:hypothetical protein
MYRALYLLQGGYETYWIEENRNRDFEKWDSTNVFYLSLYIIALIGILFCAC